MPADGDLISGYTLVELKTGLGPSRPAGRRASLGLETFYQLLGCVLHDYANTHQLDQVALYQARYGHLATWDIDELTTRLAGEPVDLSVLRRRWVTMLEAGP